MNTIQTIRKRLGMTQVEFASAIGVTQGNVSHIEQGRQEITPAVARRVIDVAAARGLVVTFDDIYRLAHQEAA
ncbi:MAG: helix-turn-helix transcriptional regulator [Thauera propionica]|jgi:putative transcriptional regulator|nr:helix-turn-helix transcriptional regulator [Thauera propionica]